MPDDTASILIGLLFFMQQKQVVKAVANKTGPAFRY